MGKKLTAIFTIHTKEGKEGIPVDTFDQLEHDSDRAAGVVAGSFVEQRLTELLRSRWPQTPLRKKLDDRLTHPGAALGSFSVKIDVAYLFGLITDVARNELFQMKEIRNCFAHNLGISSFDHQEISSRCNNLNLFTTIIGKEPPPVKRAPEKLKEAEIRFGGPNDYWRNPRSRYIFTAMTFNLYLGHRPGNGAVI
jgi:hypothetical protein